MEESKIKSGDFLQDIDIEIKIRSGKTGIRVLSKLIESVKTTLTTSLDTDLVLTEAFQSIRTNQEGNLTLVTYHLYKE